MPVRVARARDVAPAQVLHLPAVEVRALGEEEETKNTVLDAEAAGLLGDLHPIDRSRRGGRGSRRRAGHGFTVVDDEPPLAAGREFARHGPGQDLLAVLDEALGRDRRPAPLLEEGWVRAERRAALPGDLHRQISAVLPRAAHG